MEYIGSMIALALALIVVAGVGHGLWLLLAALLRLIMGTLAQPEEPSRRDVSIGPTEQLRQDLQGARRLVAYARYKNWIAQPQQNTLDQLTDFIAAQLNAPPTELVETAEVLQPTKLDIPPILADDRPAPKSELQPVAKLPELFEPALDSAVHPLGEPEPANIYSASPAVRSESAAPRPIASTITANLLRSFMEQSNIRWIELISASLIVVCSVGLVISLWNTLSSTSRYFPSLVFLLATVAVHAAGQYTLRKWNLRSTSRGILHIGLMLIPLAVLVGILLSNRDNQSLSIDFVTVVVLLTGIIVYGAAAVTGCRALFAGRYLWVAAAVIVSSLTLILVHYQKSAGHLAQSWSAVVLLPMIITTLLNILHLSDFSLPLLNRSTARLRRHAGRVAQVFFATLVPCCFWLVQSDGISGVSQTALAAAGLLLAGWTSWGWSASSSLLTNRNTRNENSWLGSGLSWYVIVAWCLASVCTLGLLAVMWQVATSTALLTGLLFAITGWWFAHGLRSGSRINLVAGSAAAILACSLSLEPLLFEAKSQLLTSDWLAFSRIASLSLVSLVFVGVGGLLLRRSSTVSVPTSSSNNTRRQLNFGAAQVAQSNLLAGSMALAASTGLTVAASLVPWSQPAYGGNWAPLLLMGYGSLLLAGGLILPRAVRVFESNPEPSVDRIGVLNLVPWSGLVVPIGQLILLLATIRLCNTASAVPSWLAELRPERAWAVGTGLLSLLWSGLAAGVRLQDTGPESGGMRWRYWRQARSLSWGAIGLVLPTAIAYWTCDDRFVLASSLGWFAPLTLVLAFVALRQSIWRELSILSLTAWASTLLLAVGLANDWWIELGAAASFAGMVILVLALLAGYEKYLGDESLCRHWSCSGPRWATCGILQGLWSIQLILISAPAAICLYSSLTHSDWTNEDSFFWIAPFTPAHSALVVTALSLLGGFTYWLKSDRQWSVRGWLAAMPVALAAVLSCNFSAPYSVPAMIAMLSGLILTLDLLPYSKLRWAAWLAELRKAQASGEAVPPSTRWLAMMLDGSLWAVAVISILLVMLHCTSDLPDPLGALIRNTSSWSGCLTNFLRLSLWSVPLMLVLGVRWLLGLSMAYPSKWISRWALATGTWVAVICTLSGTDHIRSLPLLLAQSLTLVLSVIAWQSLAFTWSRNWLALRQLDQQSSSWQLSAKARKGSRWRQTEQAAWSLWTGAMVTALALSVLATAVVAYYPNEQLLEIHRLGGGWTIFSVTAALSVLWFLGRERGLSSYGLMAVSLGMLASLASAGYGSWLVNHPAHRIVAAGNFEPYRLLVSLWLIALMLGLFVRVRSTLRSEKMSALGEIAWIVLASLTGLFAIVSLLTDSYWATGQLVVLAAIVAISSEASGQIWRGYAAAAIATVAWLPWISETTAGNWICDYWQALAGSAGVALVAMGSRLAFRNAGISPWNRGPVATLTVDRMVCLVVSIASLVFSGVWILQQSAIVSAPSSATWWVVAAVAINLVLAVLRLWESNPSQRGMSLYLAVLAATAVKVNAVASSLQLPRWLSELSWLAGLLGAMALMAILLREMIQQRSPLQQLMRWKDLAEPEKLQHASRWILSWHTLAALVCLIPSIVLVLTIPESAGRMAAIALPMLGALAILPIASHRERAFARGSVLLLVSSTLILAWWADLPAAWSLRNELQSWLFAHRLFLACIGLGIVYTLVAWKRSEGDPWTPALVAGGWICLGLGMLVGCAIVLGTFLDYWLEFPATVGLAAKLMTLVAWSAAFLKLLQLAASPMGFERRANPALRYAATYAAEATLALGCAATYQHFPYLFTGIFLSWWPLVVFAIAFISAAIGWWVQRAEQPYLADPIQRSSLLLPLIPLAGAWWVRPSSMDWPWGDWERYSLLLVTAASLYGLHGWAKRSVFWRVVSAGFALLGFWSYLFSHPEMRFFQHPQFWLLPPALGALIFVEWNRRKMDASVVTATRYISILIAYFSSSAEVFLQAFEGNLWQPLWLLVLSLCGVAAGILLRVRAFLYCGTTFLMVAMFGMVWHAAQAIDQVWPWWAFGIATGVGLIVLLGYFEKNRSRVLKYLEELKRWQT